MKDSIHNPAAGSTVGSGLGNEGGTATVAGSTTGVNTGSTVQPGTRSGAATGYGSQGPLEGQREGQRSGAKGAQIVGDTSSDTGGPGPNLMTADTLIGNSVMNHQGETLGEVEDIMLDVPRGRIAYAVMSAGGFLGIGEKLFALPWSALALDTERKCFLLDADQERIKNAPGFDKDHWPSQADNTWQDEINSYYHTRPYWDDSSAL